MIATRLSESFDVNVSSMRHLAPNINSSYMFPLSGLPTQHP